MWQAQPQQLQQLPSGRQTNIELKRKQTLNFYFFYSHFWLQFALANNSTAVAVSPAFSGQNNYKNESNHGASHLATPIRPLLFGTACVFPFPLVCFYMYPSPNPNPNHVRRPSLKWAGGLRVSKIGGLGAIFYANPTCGHSPFFLLNLWLLCVGIED